MPTAKMRIAFPLANSPASFLCCTEDPLYAGACLNSGSLLIYPTETFFALGCKCGDHSAIENILKIKKRPPGKCLPLIASNLSQAAAYCDLSSAPAELLAAFWPGPLTLILPAARSLHPALLNGEGKLAIRVSSSPLASSLARQSGEAIVSSSANISGRPAVRRAVDLDPGLMQNINSLHVRTCILAISPAAGEIKPSTIIEASFKAKKWRLRILRQGAITERMLAQRNFIITS